MCLVHKYKPQFLRDLTKTLPREQMPSYQTDEYVFSAKADWDLGKRFRRICKLAKASDLRIHGLRHFATADAFYGRCTDAIIRKMTGHRSDELERYKHFKRGTDPENTNDQPTDWSICSPYNYQITTKMWRSRGDSNPMTSALRIRRSAKT